MPIYETDRTDSGRYVATGRYHSASGWTPGMAARELADKERRFEESREATARLVGHGLSAYAMPVLANAFRACCNLVIRPIPTLVIGATFWGLHWLAMLAVPAGTWWAWGAHALFGLSALAAMATQAGELEAIEGMVITDATAGFPLAYQVAYWSAMAASVCASGYVAGLAFDWAVAGGFLRTDGIPYFRDGVQLAAGLSTFAWRGDHHPSMERPVVPWVG